MKNRIKVYWLLLLVLLYTAGTVLSVGEAQARYVTTATWNTVVQQEETGVTSDCLDDISGPELFILLGTMPQEPCSFAFYLTAREAVSGKLAWTVDSEYISAQMRIGDTVITPELAIEIPAGESVEVVLTLIPSETAFTEVREAVDASIEVIWADTLKGTFLTQLHAVEEEEKPTEETEPEPTEATEPTPTDPTDPAPTDPTDPTEPDPTEATEPDPTEPGADAAGFWLPEFFAKMSARPGTYVNTNNESSEDEPAPEEDATQPTEETEPQPSEEPDGQSEESADPSEPEAPGEGTGESGGGTGESGDESGSSDEPTEPIQEEPPEMTVHLEAVSTVNPADALPIQLTAPENGGTVYLGLASVVEPAEPEGESQTVLQTFPKYTRFSRTEGESYYMLYEADTIALNLEAGATLSLLLDLSDVNLEQLQVMLGATFQGENNPISTCTAAVIPESAQVTSVSSRILSPGTQLEIIVSEFWKDYTPQYTLEMLTVEKAEGEETETVAYKPVELPEGCLLAEFISDETGTKLIFSLGETLPPAGTYRVSLNWIHEGVCYAQMQETFFINYLVYTESEETGGAEQ